MDFSHPPDVKELSARVRAFVDEVVIPAEARDRGEHGPEADLRAELQDAARAAGLFAPHVSEELGGLGLDMCGQSALFEEAGTSLLGPLALNCAAPDDGNMAMLEKIASSEQRERYLAPLAAGEVRSCFAMTEPAPGAGSDPSMLRTTARRVDGGWVIDGDKWFITGAEGAAFAIVMARTGERIARGQGATMFLVDADNPGWRVRRVVDCIDRVAPAATPRCSCASASCATTRSSARRGRAMPTRRSGSRRRGSRTACAGWVSRAGRTRSPSTARPSGRRSAPGSRTSGWSSA
jgi:acyl-CoA dehydrogenase